MFCFFLAGRLGMTVAELLERTSSRELAEWAAYYHLGADDAVIRGLEQRAIARLEARTSKRRR
jgi:hypothetical protein